jgi:hypothetical protein
MTNESGSEASAAFDRVYVQAEHDLRQPVRHCSKELFHEQEIYRFALSRLFPGVLLAASLCPTATAQAVKTDMDQPLSVMQAVAREWNDGHFPSPAYFEPHLTIVDDTAPYLFQGEDAVRNWLEAYRRDQQKGSDNLTSLRFLEPRLVETDGSRAYVAVPAEWTIMKVDGDEANGEIERGVITAILQKTGAKWRIAAWIWTPQ